MSEQTFTYHPHRSTVPLADPCPVQYNRSMISKLLNWNIEWAAASSRRGARILARVAGVDADLICYTEATLSMIPEGGHAIMSDSDYGYVSDGRRRKVILWSKHPWQNVDTVGNAQLPGGRFVSGTTNGIRYVGVCIPWRDAHVRTGRRDRRIWEDHARYLEGLAELLATYRRSAFPVCVIGDFNQRIPRFGQPKTVASQLQRAFAGFHFATAGLKDGQNKRLIDHVATYGPVNARVDEIIPKKLAPREPYSDHVGVVASLSIQPD